MAAAKAKKKPADKEVFPDAEKAGNAFLHALGDELHGVRERLRFLSPSPPQLIHIEGGTAESRIALALWWAALLNCGQEDAPCTTCTSCMRIAANVHPDVFFFDGREESVKIDDVRALRPVMGEKPRFGSFRVVILAEAQSMRAEAANSLLKILEEPSRDTCFVFTVPQRERLLPTIVSRGWVLTLPQTISAVPSDERERTISDLLGIFAGNGTGWFQSSFCKSLKVSGSDAGEEGKGSKEASSAEALRNAQAVVNVIQKALMARHTGKTDGRLAEALQGISDNCALAADELCRQAQEELNCQVNPVYAIDSLAANLHMLVRGQGA